MLVYQNRPVSINLESPEMVLSQRHFFTFLRCHLPTLNIRLPNLPIMLSHNQTFPGWWYTYPSEKWWTESQLGWLFHSQLNGKSCHPFMFHTTNQKCHIIPKDNSRIPPLGRCLTPASPPLPPLPPPPPEVPGSEMDGGDPHTFGIVGDEEFHGFTDKSLESLG